MSSLREQLAEREAAWNLLAAFDGTTRKPEGWGYPSIEAFVLAHGEAFRGAPLPADIGQGPSGLCFTNAYELGLRLQAEGREVYYCEGFGSSLVHEGLVVPHGWLHDHDTDTVIDPTWLAPEGREYFGVSFDWYFLHECLAEHDTLPILDGSHPVGRRALRTGELKALPGQEEEES